MKRLQEPFKLIECLSGCGPLSRILLKQQPRKASNAIGENPDALMEIFNNKSRMGGRDNTNLVGLDAEHPHGPYVCFEWIKPFSPILLGWYLRRSKVSNTRMVYMIELAASFVVDPGTVAVVIRQDIVEGDVQMGNAVPVKELQMLA